MIARPAITALFALLLAGPAAAAEPDTLEISGKIAGATTRIGIAGLEALGTVEFTTKTAWTEGPVTFKAVPGDRLMAAVGAEGTSIDAMAKDGYSVTIPFADFATGAAHVATAMNGAALPDEFGPFWVVYDYDSDPALADAAHQARSIWQLRSLVVK